MNKAFSVIWMLVGFACILYWDIVGKYMRFGQSEAIALAYLVHLLFRTLAKLDDIEKRINNG